MTLNWVLEAAVVINRITEFAGIVELANDVNDDGVVVAVVEVPEVNALYAAEEVAVAREASQMRLKFAVSPPVL